MTPLRGDISTPLTAAPAVDDSAVEERAAIMESEGAWSREDAERAAGLRGRENHTRQNPPSHPGMGLDSQSRIAYHE